MRICLENIITCTIILDLKKLDIDILPLSIETQNVYFTTFQWRNTLTAKRTKYSTVTQDTWFWVRRRIKVTSPSQRVKCLENTAKIWPLILALKEWIRDHAYLKKSRHKPYSGNSEQNNNNNNNKLKMD